MADRHRPPRIPIAIALALSLAACTGAIPLAVPLAAPPAEAPPSASPARSPVAPATVVQSQPARAAVASKAPTRLPPPSPAPLPAASAPPAYTPLRPPPTAGPRVRRYLQAALDAAREEAQLPGVSATIIFPDETIWTGVSGLADVAANEPVAPETAFAVASVSKTFVAAVALELAAEGAFRLEDQVAVHLPELKLDPAITVRMLLDHTSGLSDFFLNPKIDRALQDEPARGWDPTQTLAFVGKPYFPAGTGWHYSNTNYLLLGLLIERVTGHPLATELRARFLDRLGLEHAWYQVAEEPRGPLAHGYRLDGSGAATIAVDLTDGSQVVPFRSVVTAAAAAGSVAASSLDLARWARALYGGDAIDGRSLSLMLSGVDRLADYRPPVPYGLGVQAFVVGGHRTFGHSGRFLGFRSVMRWLPDEQVAIAVLSNQSRADLGGLVARLLHIALPEPGRIPARRPS